MRLARFLPGSIALAAVACGSSLSKYPPLEGCSFDAGVCSEGPGGGVLLPDAGTTSSSGTGGSSAASDLTGTVARIDSPTFMGRAPTSLTTAASIVVQPASGSQITVPYGGTAGTSFDAMSVPAGPAWVYVADQSMGGAGIWSTISPVSVPQLAPIVLPVVDQGIFANVASSLPSVQLRGVSAGAAHVVLILQHQGAPYQGVQVTGGSAGAVVVYDTGPGVYSDQATATGTGGTIILFDAGLSGLSTIQLTDPLAMKTYSVAVFTATGAVTLASFDLE
jgi:hypothetical protein